MPKEWWGASCMAGKAPPAPEVIPPALSRQFCPVVLMFPATIGSWIPIRIQHLYEYYFHQGKCALQPVICLVIVFFTFFLCLDHFQSGRCSRNVKKYGGFCAWLSGRAAYCEYIDRFNPLDPGGRCVFGFNRKFCPTLSVSRIDQPGIWRTSYDYGRCCTRYHEASNHCCYAVMKGL